jgi:hypothetical protein
VSRPDELDLAGLAPAVREALTALLARDDPAILGVVLSGSAARGLATAHSDVDVVLVRDETGVPRAVSRSAEIDEIPVTLGELETVAPYGTPGWGYRWSFAWAPVLRDATGGRIAGAVRRQATITDAEARQILLEANRLDGFVNLAYRALKSHRDGRAWEARLDCAEVIPWLLDVVFTLHGRVRPYNKYLAWELREHPLPGTEWDAAPFTSRLEALLDGSEIAMCELFGAVERECRDWDSRAGGHALADLIESWDGPSLRILRGDLA